MRELTSRTRGISIEQMTSRLADHLRGWKAYLGFCETPSVLETLDQWHRRRLRSMIWKQWKPGAVRFRRLCVHQVGQKLARQTAASPLGSWRIADSPAMNIAFPLANFDSLGLPRLLFATQLNSPNRQIRTRMSGGVAGESGRPSP
ncbi:MAG: group II intron maturase-specific domain-containing protein [Terracidiphilus sp.]